MATRKPVIDLDDLLDELNRGKVYECSLRDPDERFSLDGMQSGACVYIDPRPAILETLIHELIHRRKPRLTERTVTITARNIVVAMDEATKRLWWQRYKRIRKKGRPMDLPDD